MKKININELNMNPCVRFAEDWALLTAGNSKDNYNTMTISWGEIGSLWGHRISSRYVATVYVRPQRYTRIFMDDNDYFTICFFADKYHGDLGYLGSHSGRDEDKVSKTSLTPCENDKAVYFNEAEVVLRCHKIYAQDIKEECFLDKTVREDIYPLKDYHRMYIGEIEEVLVKD